MARMACDLLFHADRYGMFQNTATCMSWSREQLKPIKSPIMWPDVSILRLLMQVGRRALPSLEPYLAEVRSIRII
jgi:hypothetical protein